MIVYQGLIKDFHQDVINGIIADCIEDGFKKHGYCHNNPAEHRAFVNSLPQLDGVFDSSFGVNGSFCANARAKCACVNVKPTAFSLSVRTDM